MIKHTEEFKQEAVRIALTSGLPRDRVASATRSSPSCRNRRTPLLLLEPCECA